MGAADIKQMKRIRIKIRMSQRVINRIKYLDLTPGQYFLALVKRDLNNANNMHTT